MPTLAACRTWGNPKAAWELPQLLCTPPKLPLRCSAAGLCCRCCSCWLERRGSSLKYADAINGQFSCVSWRSPLSAARVQTRARRCRFQPTTIWFSQFRNVGGAPWKITSGICSGNPSRVKERQIIRRSTPLYTLTNT